MGNTTVDPKNTACICGSVVKIENEKLKEGNNGPLYVAQGEELEIKVSSAKGYKINEYGEVIRPDGSKTGSTMSPKEEEEYNGYKSKINKAKQKSNER